METNKMKKPKRKRRTQKYKRNGNGARKEKGIKGKDEEIEKAYEYGRCHATWSIGTPR